MRTEPRKLIASDLDGTFLAHDGSITDRNIAAVETVASSDLEIVFITGRPARWLSPIASRIGYTGLMIGGNGSFVADMKIHQVLSAETVESVVAEAAVKRILEHFPDTHFMVERSFPGMSIPSHSALDYASLKEIKSDELQVAASMGYEEKWSKEIQVPLFEISDLVALGHITKLIAKPADILNWNPDNWYEAIGDLVGEIITVNHAAQNYPLAEMSGIGIDKGTALKAYAANLGMTEFDVAAIGDMPNDIPMLNWAREGWAVANAHREVKNAADFVSDAATDSPVADLIHDLLQRLPGTAAAPTAAPTS